MKKENTTVKTAKGDTTVKTAKENTAVAEAVSVLDIDYRGTTLVDAIEVLNKAREDNPAVLPLLSERIMEQVFKPENARIVDSTISEYISLYCTSKEQFWEKYLHALTDTADTDGKMFRPLHYTIYGIKTDNKTGVYSIGSRSARLDLMKVNEKYAAVNGGTIFDNAQFMRYFSWLLMNIDRYSHADDTAGYKLAERIPANVAAAMKQHGFDKSTKTALKEQVKVCVSMLLPENMRPVINGAQVNALLDASKKVDNDFHFSAQNRNIMLHYFLCMVQDRRMGLVKYTLKQDKELYGSTAKDIAAEEEAAKIASK